MRPGLTVHVASSLNELTNVMNTYLVDPARPILEPAWTVIPSAGVRQWLDWRLAEVHGTSSPNLRDGITANLRYMFPEEFVREIERRALGSRGEIRHDSDQLELLLRLLEPDISEGRFDRASSLATEVDELIRWRPDYVRRSETPPPGAADALSAYRALTATGIDPLGQRDRAAAVLRTTALSDVPSRIFLYGFTNVPGGREFVELMSHVATHCEVHVLLASPLSSRNEQRERQRQLPVGVWFDEAFETLELWSSVNANVEWVTSRHDVETTTSLSRVRQRLQGHVVATGDVDDTFQLVGAVGASRQVEVLRDLILGAIETSDITEHDVLVLCTDPEKFAGLFERHWKREGQSRETSARLNFETAESDSALSLDRLHALCALVDVLGNYVTVDHVLKLLSFPCIASALGLSEAQRSRLFQLASEAPVTFGVSPRQRDEFAVYVAANTTEWRNDLGTWQRLSDRVALNVLFPAEANEPTLGVSDDISLVAVLQPLLRLLDETHDVRHRVQTLSQWLVEIHSWKHLLAGTSDDDQSLTRALDRMSSLTSDVTGAPAVLLSFADISSILLELASSSSRQHVIGRGGVTVARITTLTCAPYRMICLVGFDDDTLPAAQFRSGVLGERRAGDPHARHAVLAGMIAALSSATERLIVTYTHRREDNGRDVEPSIVLEELLDTVCLDAPLSQARAVRRTSRHGFLVNHDDPQEITSTYERHFSAAPGSTTDDGGIISRDDIDASALREFLRHPAQFHVRRVRGAGLPADAPSDSVVPPVEISPRHRSQLQRLYRDKLFSRLAAVIADFGVAVPDFVTADHEPGSGCATESCAWMHLITSDVRRSLLSNESLTAAIPTRLWQRALNFDALDLAAYNAAVDATDFLECDLDSLTRAQPFFELTGSRTLDVRRVATGGSLFVARHRDSGALCTIRHTVRTLDRTRQSWSDILESAVELAILQLLEPDGTVEGITYFVSDSVSAYKRKQDRRLKGEFPLNPRARLHFAGGRVEATNVINNVVALFDDAHRTPPALFRQTSVAAVATGLGQSAPNAWRASGYSAAYGEGDQPIHTLLFPVDFEELSTLQPGQDFPHASALRHILGDFVFDVSTKATREPALVIQQREPDRWSELAPPAIAPLIAREFGAS